MVFPLRGPNPYLTLATKNQVLLSTILRKRPFNLIIKTHRVNEITISLFLLGGKVNSRIFLFIKKKPFWHRNRISMEQENREMLQNIFGSDPGSDTDPVHVGPDQQQWISRNNRLCFFSSSMKYLERYGIYFSYSIVGSISNIIPPPPPPHACNNSPMFH
jgi:hypothetical protein